MKIEKIPASKLRVAPYNPRVALRPGDPEFEKLKNSIASFGYVEPLVVNSRTMHIVGGNQRFQVLTELGVKEIDCVMVDLGDYEEKALNVALNKISGEWDMPLLADLLRDIEGSDLDVSLTGFELAELDEMFADLISERESLPESGEETESGVPAEPGGQNSAGRARKKICLRENCKHRVTGA